MFPFVHFQLYILLECLRALVTPDDNRSDQLLLLHTQHACSLDMDTCVCIRIGWFIHMPHKVVLVGSLVSFSQVFGQAIRIQKDALLTGSTLVED